MVRVTFHLHPCWLRLHMKPWGGAAPPWCKRYWFSAGLAVAIVLSAVVVLALLLHPFSSMLAGPPLISERAGVRLEAMVPGVTFPWSHAPLVWGAVAVSMWVHEAGHAMAAVSEGVQVLGAGVSVLGVLPIAHVTLDDMALGALHPLASMRIHAAGIWHNMARPPPSPQT
mmetsp:Transcript_11805/g.37508  ORF Transcript_11805/g.37508 Transcript_11805/m.37508 type:complete len:170 (-) Transcript_11805:349-858(-)